MLRSFFRHALVAAIAALALATTSTAADDTLCALAPGTYAAAKAAHPDAAFAIAELEKHTIATWYSDRGADFSGTAKSLVANCPSSSRLSVVVYGLPNKDCDAGYSNGGTNKNAGDYAAYLNTLAGIIGNRKVLYVLEPDAVGLLAKAGGCAEASGYKSNLQTAVKILSQNPNAEIYLDVGYWTLQYDESTSKVAGIVKDIAAAGRVKGITLNTSNYRSNGELAKLCANFQTAIGSKNYNCVIDTSRNYNGAPTSNEWCNTRSAGIGKVPTASTGVNNIDYFIWIKPPGESDGQCNGNDRTADAMKGPSAGAFFADSFKLLWNQGALVKEMGMARIDGSVRPFAATTPAPVKQQEQQQETPAPTTQTSAPTQMPTSTPVATIGTPAQEDRSIDVDTATPANGANATASDATTAAPTTATALGVPEAITTTVDDASNNNNNNNALVLETVAPVASNEPTTAPSTAIGGTTSDQTDVQQVSNQSKNASMMGNGIFVLFGMVGAAVVALVAVVGLRRRQQKLLHEAKTPTEPYPTYAIQSTAARDASVL